jgi:predicted small integral membrane protein
MRWEGHVAHMREIRNAYEILVVRSEGRRPRGKPRHRWKDNIKMDLRETAFGDVDWTHLAQDRDWWQIVVNMVMNLQVA